MDLKVIFALALNLYLVAGDCPLGFIAKGSSCYFFSHDEQEWVNAGDICRNQLNAELAEINDAAENAILLGLVHANHEGYWVGHDDIQTEGVWKLASSKQNMTYFNWHAGEPNNYKQSEDCLALLEINGVGWFDAPCSTPLHYICEMPLHPTL